MNLVRYAVRVLKQASMFRPHKPRIFLSSAPRGVDRATLVDAHPGYGNRGANRHVADVSERPNDRIPPARRQDEHSGRPTSPKTRKKS